MEVVVIVEEIHPQAGMEVEVEGNRESSVQDSGEGIILSGETKESGTRDAGDRTGGTIETSSEDKEDGTMSEETKSGTEAEDITTATSASLAEVPQLTSSTTEPVRVETGSQIIEIMEQRQQGGTTRPPPGPKKVGSILQINTPSTIANTSTTEGSSPRFSEESTPKHNRPRWGQENSETQSRYEPKGRESWDMDEMIVNLQELGKHHLRMLLNNGAAIQREDMKQRISIIEAVSREAVEKAGEALSKTRQDAEDQRTRDRDSSREDSCEALIRDMVYKEHSMFCKHMNNQCNNRGEETTRGDRNTGNKYRPGDSGDDD
jgi:hypothetical protein